MFPQGFPCLDNTVTVTPYQKIEEHTSELMLRCCYWSGVSEVLLNSYNGRMKCKTIEQRYMETSPPRVSIIILNWNGWKDTVECLESLYQIAYQNYDAIVVDNGSVDSSIERIREYAEGKINVVSPFFKRSQKSKPIQCIEYSKEESEGRGGKEIETADLQFWNKLILIKNEENYGFAEGNNIAIRYALRTLDPEYVLLLNNDTVAEKDFLKEMVIVSLQDNNNAIIGPKVLYYNYRGQRNVIHSAGANIQVKQGLAPPIGMNEIDVGQYDEIRHVDYIEGACMLVKRGLINTIGLLDHAFFAYWEETDWCYRASKRGFNIVYVPTAKIWHKVPEKKISRLATYLHTRNKFIFMKKNAEIKDLYIFCIYYLTFYFWYRLAIIIFYYRNLDVLRSHHKGSWDGLLFLITGRYINKSQLG